MVTGGAEEIAGRFGKVCGKGEGRSVWTDRKDRGFFGKERRCNQETLDKRLPLQRVVACFLLSSSRYRHVFARIEARIFCLTSTIYSENMEQIR